MATSNLSDCSATELFPSIGFQIINEVSLKAIHRATEPEQTIFLIVGLGMSAPFLQNQYAFAFPSLNGVLSALF
jgi:hypothetical protein